VSYVALIGGFSDCWVSVTISGVTSGRTWRIIVYVGIRVLAAVIALCLGSNGVAQSTTWRIDDQHTTIEFSVSHLAISTVRGRFLAFSGFVQMDQADMAQSTIDVTIAVNSVNTGVEQRDRDLTSSSFFDGSQYPEMKFKSKRIARDGNKMEVFGDLSMHGVTRGIMLELVAPETEVTDPYLGTRRGFIATTTLNRRDYSLVWHGLLRAADKTVGDEVVIRIDGELVKQGVRPPDPH
jgi:polyisoprenoid-binding protein YceI